jgi:hypothetical protein
MEYSEDGLHKCVNFSLVVFSLKIMSHLAPIDIVKMELSGSMVVSSSECSGRKASPVYLFIRHWLTSGPGIGVPGSRLS